MWNNTHRRKLWWCYLTAVFRDCRHIFAINRFVGNLLLEGSHLTVTLHGIISTLTFLKSRRCKIYQSIDQQIEKIFLVNIESDKKCVLYCYPLYFPNTIVCCFLRFPILSRYRRTTMQPAFITFYDFGPASDQSPLTRHQFFHLLFGLSRP